MHNTRDKYSSTSSKNLSWDANHKKAPPAPATHATSHSRNTSRDTATPPPPPPQRGPLLVRKDTKPERTPSPALNERPSARRSKSEGDGQGKKVDWKNLSKEDKRVFFGWLDEFFGKKLKANIKPRKSESTIQVYDRSDTPPRPVSTLLLAVNAAADLHC